MFMEVYPRVVRGGGLSVDSALGIKWVSCLGPTQYPFNNPDASHASSPDLEGIEPAGGNEVRCPTCHINIARFTQPTAPDTTEHQQSLNLQAPYICRAPTIILPHAWEAS